MFDLKKKLEIRNLYFLFIQSIFKVLRNTGKRKIKFEQQQQAMNLV